MRGNSKKKKVSLKRHRGWGTRQKTRCLIYNQEKEREGDN